LNHALPRIRNFLLGTERAGEMMNVKYVPRKGT
jgi:hypothetical protein